MIRIAPMILAVLLACASARADVTVRAHAAPDEINLAGIITLTITATTPTGWILGDPDPLLTEDAALGAFTIASIDRRPPTIRATGEVDTTFILTLAPSTPGPAAIPPISFSARLADSLESASAQSPEITINVRSVLDDIDPESFTPGEIRPPLVPKPTADSHTLRTMLISGAIGAAIAIAFVALRSRTRRTHASVLDACGNRLDTLAGSTGPIAATAREASDCVRTALAEAIDPRFRTCAAGAETEILLKAMPHVPADHRLAIATFLADAEHLSCAPSSTRDEAARLLDAGRACIAHAREADAASIGGAT